MKERRKEGSKDGRTDGRKEGRNALLEAFEGFGGPAHGVLDI